MNLPNDPPSILAAQDPGARFRILVMVDLGNGVSIALTVNQKEARKVSRDFYEAAEAASKYERGA